MKLVDNITKFDVSIEADPRITKEFVKHMKKADKYLQKQGQVSFRLPKKEKDLLGFLVELPSGNIGTVVKQFLQYCKVDINEHGIIEEKTFKTDTLKPIF